MKTLQAYLTENYTRGIIDHALRVSVDEKGSVSFYIHPFGQDGETLDFDVDSNALDSRENLSHEPEKGFGPALNIKLSPRQQAYLEHLLSWQKLSAHSNIVLGGSEPFEPFREQNILPVP